MRSKLAQAVRREFHASLKRSLPQFRRIKAGEIEMFGRMEKAIHRGNQLYLWDFKDDLYFYLMLGFASPKMGDAFTIECAWTKNKQFPALARLMHPLDIPELGIVHDEPIQASLRFRIADLWKSPRDHWWWVAPQPSYGEFEKALLSQNFKDTPVWPKEMPLEEAMNNVKPCVDDAVKHIIEYAIPYFENVMSEYEREPRFWKRFEKPDNVQAEKERLVKCQGGVSRERCIWVNCDKPRLKGVCYCIDHLYECRVR